MTRIHRLSAPALAVLAICLGATGAAAQVPAEGLRLEGEQRWREALAIYEPIVRDAPGRVDLWLRIADIRAALGDGKAAIAALEAAAGASPGDPATLTRLSRAYAAAGHPAPARLAIRAALALSPSDPALLRAAGELASWNGEHGEARRHYDTLLRLQPDDDAAWLAVARARTWDGATDAAVAAYRTYLDRAPGDPDGWLELARAESWRGNDAAAADALATYRRRFGETTAWRRTRVSVLLRGGRPRAALAVLAPLRPGEPLSYDLYLLEGLARVGEGDARRTREVLGSVQMLGPERRETTGLAQQVRAAFGSTLQPSVSGYADSDGLRSYRVPASVSLVLSPEVRVAAGYERLELRARAGSGLDRIDGGTVAETDRGWAGVELRLRPAVVVRAAAGRQVTPGRDLWTYDAGLALSLGDRARLGLDYEHALFTISPRTVSLGLTRTTTRVRFDAAPGFHWFVEADGSAERLSDGNTRWSGLLSPRRAVVRRQALNLDLGVSGYWFGAAHDLENGYYDPGLYQAYSVVAVPYFKFSENTGLSLFVQAGAQKDDRQRGFEPGGNVAAELTLGIYRAWVLKVHASATQNARLESGAFRGRSAGAVLLRRW
jgi:cytochrome c-type biogenesis protein CcmH/NrfG